MLLPDVPGTSQAWSGAHHPTEELVDQGEAVRTRLPG